MQRVFEAYGGRRGTTTEGEVMAKKPPFTIDPSLYEGRKFDPIFEDLGPFVETPGDPDGTNELICMSFVAPTKMGATVSIHAGINPATWGGIYGHPHGLPCMISITSANGDFTHNATANLGAGETSLGAMVGGYPRPGLYVALNPGEKYIVNVAPTERDAQPGMRVTLSGA